MTWNSFYEASRAGLATAIAAVVIITAWLVGSIFWSVAFGAERGIASVYGGSDGCGKPVASGGVLHCGALTAAHRKFPFGSRVRVTTKSGRSIMVQITDRGPYVRGRIIDLTPAGARALGFSGLAYVTVERVQ